MVQTKKPRHVESAEAVLALFGKVPDDNFKRIAKALPEADQNALSRLMDRWIRKSDAQRASARAVGAQLVRAAGNDALVRIARLCLGDKEARDLEVVLGKKSHPIPSDELPRRFDLALKALEVAELDGSQKMSPKVRRLVDQLRRKVTASSSSGDQP